ncbi:MAG: GntR family transcriptional regulator [Anaerolineae bacterium]
MIRIDPDSTVPIYLQIVQDIKHQVATGAFKPGQQLPTVRELAATLRINPNTVARAYDQLDTDQVISTQQGRGTFVREHPNEAHLTYVREERLRTLAERTVGNALSLGYTEAEIRAAFQAALAHWAKLKKA